MCFEWKREKRKLRLVKKLRHEKEKIWEKITLWKLHLTWIPSRGSVVICFCRLVTAPHSSFCHASSDLDLWPRPPPSSLTSDLDLRAHLSTFQGQILHLQWIKSSLLFRDYCRSIKKCYCKIMRPRAPLAWLLQVINAILALKQYISFFFLFFFWKKKWPEINANEKGSHF